MVLLLVWVILVKKPTNPVIKLLQILWLLLYIVLLVVVIGGNGKVYIKIYLLELNLLVEQY